jgi:hypothetical protein
LAAASATDLRTAELLRRDWPADLVAAASEQAALRDRAGRKFERAATMLFTRAGLEQASSEVTAGHRAARFSTVAGPVADLCCGIGADLTAIGTAIGRPVLGVDRDETHALLARHNAAGSGVEAAVAVADVRNLRLPAAATVFVDPARRGAAGRRGGYAPELDWCLGLPVARTAVKAAPGLDPAAAPTGWELEFVAVHRELKEAVLWSPGFDAAARTRATVLPGGHSMVADPSAPEPPMAAPARFLLDPSPAVTRAGLVRTLAAQVAGAQIDRRIAFLTAEVPMATPFGRTLRVEASLPFGIKSLAAELRRLDIRPAEFRRRGLAGDVGELGRRLPGSGTRPGTVVLTRVADRPWVLVCLEP